RRVSETAIILTTTLLFAFAGCGESFSKNSIMSQIDNNLGWHEGGIETCVYDVTIDGVKVGEYTSVMKSLFNQSIEINSSTDSVKPTLTNFTGYKFTSSMSAEYDGKTFVKETESYATHRLEPKLSYSKTVEDGETIEIVTSYEEKKSNVTFIKNGEITTDSAKYSKSAFVVDNSFLYQFARATTLASSVSIVVPTYNANASNTKNSSFTCSYASVSNVVLANKFVLNKSFSQTIASGEVSGEEVSGAVNTGVADNSGDITTSDADESGNVTVTYPNTLTASIPVVKCTFTTAQTFPASGSISCMIATAAMKEQGDSRFVNRVVARFQEDKIVYNLTSVNYTL
ncbi:MAG: hypothetical protein K2L61_04355, partial [Clostridia bacterium]|nr:hypothetical protein [Clostridia bacterium]